MEIRPEDALTIALIYVGFRTMQVTALVITCVALVAWRLKWSIGRAAVVAIVGIPVVMVLYFLFAPVLG